MDGETLPLQLEEPKTAGAMSQKLEKHHPVLNRMPHFELPPVDAAQCPVLPEVHSASEPEAVPGTLAIEILGGTGQPVISPLPPQNQTLILDNRSGGQMAVIAAPAAGTVNVVIPDGGTVALVPSTPGHACETKVSVQKRRKICTPMLGGGGITCFWDTFWAELKDSSSNSGDAFYANGRHSIDLNGNLT